jgi:uncharacterized membrane protein
MKLRGRRRVLWDYVAGALWVLPTLSVVVFLLAGAALSRVEMDEGSLLSGWPSRARPRTPAPC